jgi:3-methyladenine DNA glycosylase AlkD
VKDVEAKLTPLASPERAAKMAAYMKGHFPFLGISAPDVRAAAKSFLKPDAALVPAIVAALWHRREREYQYVALSVLRKSVRKLDPATMLQLIERLALEKSWWDCVDELASIASGILLLNPGERTIVTRWSAHPSFWINRLAILHQKNWNGATEAETLFDVCLEHAHNPEIFIRKAIGWALREYAWSNPHAVRQFVDENRDRLSPLSTREALKNMTKLIMQDD